MRSILKIATVFLLACILLTSCGISDLRTITAKEAPDESRAKQLLKEMGKAHGIDQWQSIDTYNVIFYDEFFGIIGKSSNPFPRNRARFKLTYIPSTFDGQLLFLSGKNKGETWGIQSWNTYTINKQNVIEFKKDKDIFFWVPTYQYFIEFPMRIQSATSIAYAGSKDIKGVACEGVIASWNTTAPQKEIDQYLIWIDKKTKRIVKLEYTIREMFKFLTGAVYFDDYQDYDGLILPLSLPVESNLTEKWLHEMQILGFTKNPVSQKMLRPNPELQVVGDDKKE